MKIDEIAILKSTRPWKPSLLGTALHWDDQEVTISRETAAFLQSHGRTIRILRAKVPGLAPRFMKLPPPKTHNVFLRVVTDDSKEKWYHLSNNIATATHQIQGRKLVSSRLTRSICCAAGLCYCPDTTHDAANRVMRRTLTSSFSSSSAKH